jgi:hypothetical protein
LCLPFYSLFILYDGEVQDEKRCESKQVPWTKAFVPAISEYMRRTNIVSAK